MFHPAGKNCATPRDAVRIFKPSTGRGYRLEATQFLPYRREEVFEFFSDAFNLQTLTPAWLHFTVLTPPPIQIMRGTLIDYKLRLRGIPLRWQSRISVWEPPFRFVDEQVRGPYRLWHHEHVFEEVSGGTLCHDYVDYAVYGGRLINSLLVRPDLMKIFSIRQQKLRELFPTAPAQDSLARS